MKKLLLVLLGLTLTLAGCGELTAEDKDSLIEKLTEMDEVELEEKLKETDYTEVDNENVVYYISADYIKEDKISTDDLVEYIEGIYEGESFLFMNYFGQSGFMAVSVEEVKDGYIQYGVTITSEKVTLVITLSDKDEQEVTSAKFTYEDGELTLDEDSGDGSEEYDELLDKHTKKAKKFFEKTFKELDSVINY